MAGRSSDGDMTEEEEEDTATGTMPRRQYVPDQPKLLLHEPPVDPLPEKEPLPPSVTNSSKWTL